MTLPTLAEIESLHRKYAPTSEVYELVYTHCQIIERIAEQLTADRNLKIDRELVRVGCLLHDIGVYALYDTEGNYAAPTGHYITHGLEGEHILKAEGYSEVLWRFASHHTGVGLSR